MRGTIRTSRRNLMVVFRSLVNGTWWSECYYSPSSGLRRGNLLTPVHLGAGPWASGESAVRIRRHGSPCLSSERSHLIGPVGRLADGSHQPVAIDALGNQLIGARIATTATQWPGRGATDLLKRPRAPTPLVSYERPPAHPGRPFSVEEGSASPAAHRHANDRAPATSVLRGDRQAGDGSSHNDSQVAVRDREGLDLRSVQRDVGEHVA
jgi:hypothetical protein